MASRTSQSVVTKKEVLTKVKKHLEGLTTRQANVLRMLHGLDVDPKETVGGPPKGCSPETLQKVREIELQVLSRAFNEDVDDPSGDDGPKKRIIKTLKKKND